MPAHAGLDLRFITEEGEFSASNIPGELAKPNVENAMQVARLEDLLKSTVGPAEWLRQGS